MLYFRLLKKLNIRDLILPINWTSIDHKVMTKWDIGSTGVFKLLGFHLTTLFFTNFYYYFFFGKQRLHETLIK